MNQQEEHSGKPVSAQSAGAQPPKKRSPKKTILLAVVIAAISLAVPFFTFWWPDYQQNQLIETGEPAEGKILSIEPTGNRYNSQYEYAIQVEVYPENAQTFQAEVRMVINAIYAPQFQPGHYVLVKYDPEDPSKIAIEETLGERDHEPESEE